MSLNKNIAVIMGDGIGPEIISQSIRVLDTPLPINLGIISNIII